MDYEYYEMQCNDCGYKYVIAIPSDQPQRERIDEVVCPKCNPEDAAEVMAETTIDKLNPTH